MQTFSHLLTRKHAVSLIAVVSITVMWFAAILYLISINVATKGDLYNRVNNDRNKYLKKELEMMLGSDIELDDNEEKVNKILMDLKERELNDGFNHPETFNLSKHFFEYKDVVKESQLFKIIEEMPKGAVLHAHDTGLLGPDYVLQITYMDNLYACFYNSEVDFLFSDKTPVTFCRTEWKLLQQARQESGDVEAFDSNLRKHFTLVIDNPQEVYTDVNAVWNYFQQYFITTTPLFTYKPVWDQYFYDSLKAFRNDNVMYVEIRSVLPQLYDLNGNVYEPLYTAESYKKVLEKFMEDYPDFFGAKLIYAPLRLVNENDIKEYIKTAKELKATMPDFVAGFDLVGQEDLGGPLREFLKVLCEVKDLDFFFHAGETSWYGSRSDENLADAIALGARRIGHAFALIKHPVLMQEVSRRNIAIEANVVSNTVLKLIDDVRNHPLASLMAQNLPVVISSDDPGVWEAEPLSHDFYVTFVGVASRHADLRLLKKLALNSIYYSMAENKDYMLQQFEKLWTKFIHKVLDQSRQLD